MSDYVQWIELTGSISQKTWHEGGESSGNVFSQSALIVLLFESLKKKEG